VILPGQLQSYVMRRSKQQILLAPGGGRAPLAGTSIFVNGAFGAS